MNFKWAIAVLAIIALIASAVPVAVAEENTEIVITDSRGITTTLSQPATHVASFGAFATNTLVDIGYLSKAVILDSGSAYAKSGIPEVQNYSDDMFITVSSANKDQVVQKMMYLANEGIWNKTNDVILGYGYSYLNSTWTELQDQGFHVVTFYPNSYDGIVKVVEDIETIVGAEHEVSEQMAYIKQYIADTLLDNGINDTSEKVTAVYVSYSNSVYRLGNGGSVTVDFINYAGGNNLGNDTSKAIPTYSVDLTAIIQLSPEYVLLDGYYSGSAQDFADLIDDSSIQVYKLNKSWNSYCPDAMTGLWTVACLFYPDYFEGAIPQTPTTSNDDNTMLYVGVGAVVVVIAVAAVIVMRKRNK